MQLGDFPDRMHGSGPVVRPALPLVLLVEDDFVLRMSLSELLSAEGFRVESCADGRDAYRRLHMPPRPDVMLLDIMLPHLDGLELRALQTRSHLIANIPVVVITAYDLSNTNADELGLSTRFSKPIDTEKLVATLRDIVRARPA
jgi:CheY-like chemotaxis protein